MPSAIHIATTFRNARIDAIGDQLDSGYLRIYDGSQPANANTAITGQVLLAELRFNAAAFPAASSGSATAASITSDASADATGTATWFRLFKSDGTTVVLDGSVGTSNADLIMATTSIVAGAIVSCSSFVISEAA